MADASPLHALAAVVVRLLAADGRPELSELVARSELSLVPGAETWHVGDRQVHAQRLALVADADDFVRLRVHEGLFERVRWAVSAAMRSADTELVELLLVARLPMVGKPWSGAYRDAPTPVDDYAASEVLECAARIARAYGDARAEGMLRRAELDDHAWPSPDPGAPDLRRVILRLTAQDLVEAERDSDLGERLERVVRHAATRARSQVASVELRARVREAPGRAEG